MGIGSGWRSAPGFCRTFRKGRLILGPAWIWKGPLSSNDKALGWHVVANRCKIFPFIDRPGAGDGTASSVRQLPSRSQGRCRLGRPHSRLGVEIPDQGEQYPAASGRLPAPLSEWILDRAIAPARLGDGRKTDPHRCLRRRGKTQLGWEEGPGGRSGAVPGRPRLGGHFRSGDQQQCAAAGTDRRDTLGLPLRPRDSEGEDPQDLIGLARALAAGSGADVAAARSLLGRSLITDAYDAQVARRETGLRAPRGYAKF